MRRARAKAINRGLSAARLTRAAATLLALICATESVALTRAAAATVGPTIAGRASIVDGDTIEIHGQRIRLHGIDAPESNQLCRDANGAEYRCGQKAALALADKIGARPVSCEQRSTDGYNRIVALCRSNGVDLNAWLVEEGWAIAYRRFSTDYVSAELSAKNAKRGIWAGTFVEPEVWRRENRALTRPEKPERTASCNIKGNINGKSQRIYHVPSGHFYDRVAIDPRKGERWFCSEAEAEAAGWRRSKR